MTDNAAGAASKEPSALEPTLAAIRQLNVALTRGDLHAIEHANQLIMPQLAELSRLPVVELAPLRRELAICSELLIRARAFNQRALSVHFDFEPDYLSNQAFSLTRKRPTA